jgi:hypothetical protein
MVGSRFLQEVDTADASPSSQTKQGSVFVSLPDSGTAKITFDITRPVQLSRADPKLQLQAGRWEDSRHALSFSGFSIYGARSARQDPSLELDLTAGEESACQGLILIMKGGAIHAHGVNLSTAGSGEALADIDELVEVAVIPESDSDTETDGEELKT